MAGHGGELVFAGIFFWRAWTGGFTHSMQERYTYASLACFLVVANLVFHFKLMTSAAYRMYYVSPGSGSFGLENDYLRVARDYMGVSLATVGGMMFLVNAVLLPVVVWRLARRG